MLNSYSYLILNKSANTLIRKLYTNKVNVKETVSISPLEVVVNVSIEIVYRIKAMKVQYINFTVQSMDYQIVFAVVEQTWLA